MFIASCTGSSGATRSEALLRNAVYGLAAAKACGIENPSLAFLNIDGAGPVLRALSKMRDNGYAVTFGTIVFAMFAIGYVYSDVLWWVAFGITCYGVI